MLMPAFCSSPVCTWLLVIVSIELMIALTYCCISSTGCSSRMKKCVKCRTPIEKSLPFIVCCGGKRKLKTAHSSHVLSAVVHGCSLHVVLFSSEAETRKKWI